MVLTGELLGLPSAALPAAVLMSRAPSVLDVWSDKWFGSLSTASSQYDDSSGSVSPAEQRRREAAGTISNAAGRGRGQDPWRADDGSDKRRRAAAVPGGEQPSHSGSSHSSSRSIATTARLPEHLTVRRRPRHQHRRAGSDGEATPAAAGTGDLTSTLLPQTPEWLREGNLSVSDSGLETPRNPDDLYADATLADRGAVADSESAPYWEAVAAQQGPPKQQHQQTLENGGSWGGRQKHFGRDAVDSPPRTSSEGSSSTATLSDRVGGGSGTPSGASANGCSPPVAGQAIGANSPEPRVLGSLPTAIPGKVAPRNHAIKAACAAGTGAGAKPIANGAADEDVERNEAWRWRFGRRWRAEQAKQLDPNYGQEPDDEDTWDAALGYMDACGAGYHLQIARTTSVDKSLGHSIMGSSQMLLDDSFLNDETPLADAGELDATKRIGAMAKKAQELMLHQKEIEKRVSERWGDVSAAGTSWAGQYLPTVEIDTYGCFAFILVKVADRTGVNKLLVRGKNHSNERQLLQAVYAEVGQVVSMRRVPSVATELIGSGVMEWSRERDRYLNVSEGRVVMGSHTSVQTRGDVARLAGALTRCSLPMHYHITVEGQKLM